MMYRNGKLFREVMLSEDDMKALVNPTTNIEDAQTARAKVRRHLDGPSNEVYDLVDDAIGDGLTFRRDAARLRLANGDLVILEVCPDGDVDAEGRPIDCTTVQATWLIDDQSVEFNLDDEHEVIHQWRQE